MRWQAILAYRGYQGPKSRLDILLLDKIMIKSKLKHSLNSTYRQVSVVRCMHHAEPFAYSRVKALLFPSLRS